MLTLLKTYIDLHAPATPYPHSTILILAHAHLILSTAYHAYDPAAPYRYVSPPTPCLPLTILTLPQACLILSALYNAYAAGTPFVLG
ncbi:hypothetical protein O181_003688 [Austropuccinia psidii MF-1]|uniref:Uncharacterized protein n=1 Tax=Austropuccinia psidii MF-1 TaxID=1389203 RepID=A0A9Q3GDT2_9BASI|nr:hypothetical protein [Austropuccinia psidii MF-1]